METRGAAYGAIEDGLVAVTGSTIAWVGPTSQAPPGLISEPGQELDAAGGWITPGLIDCHTHLVFGGNRAHEFEMRLQGASYEDIARSGGGILSTVRATRAAPYDTLLSGARGRLRTLASHGATTVEIKSGYGLDVETELTMLRVARQLGAEEPVTVSTTLLGAHAFPPDFDGDRDGYVRLVCEQMIPRAVEEGLADAVDAFCEGIAFTQDECEQVLAAGQDQGLLGRLHADQLSDLGGAALAARLSAVSADHLEYTTPESVELMAEAGTTAVLLPGAFYYLREERTPPIEALRGRGVPLAVGTDLNPGSSPIVSPLAAMNMACVLFGLTPEEAIAGMTRNAAPVLGMDGVRGVLREGSQADLVVWDVQHPAELCYWLGSNPCKAVVQEGSLVRHS